MFEVTGNHISNKLSENPKRFQVKYLQVVQTWNPDIGYHLDKICVYTNQRMLNGTIKWLLIYFVTTDHLHSIAPRSAETLNINGSNSIWGKLLLCHKGCDQNRNTQVPEHPQLPMGEVSMEDRVPETKHACQDGYPYTGEDC